MATGAPGTNGVWQYGEDDSEATFSALLNKAASTTDTQIGADRARLTTLEAVPQPGLVRIIPTSTAYTGGSAPTVSSNGLVTFGSSTVISLNGCFNSSYTNYRIQYTNTAGTANGTDIYMRLRAAGADNTSSSYFLTGNSVNNAGGAFNRVAGAQPNWFVTQQRNVSGRMGNFWLDITNPFEAAPTYTNGQTSYDNGSNFLHEQNGGSHVVASSFDGFTLYSASGFSGTLQVFGYRR